MPCMGDARNTCIILYQGVFNDLSAYHESKCSGQDLRRKNCFDLFLQLFEMTSVDSLPSIPEKKFLNIVTLLSFNLPCDVKFAS